MQPPYIDAGAVLEPGIFAKTFRRASVDEIFDAIASHGLTCTQWNWACIPGLSSLPEAVPPQVVNAVSRAAARFGVRICAISATFNLIGPATRDMGLARLVTLAQAAVSLDCRLLTLCTGTRHATDMWAYHPDNETPEAWTDMIDSLRRAVTIARTHGVRLGIEPETANIVSDAARAQRMLRELDPEGECLSIILDAANLYRPPNDPRRHLKIMDDAVARLRDHIVIAHAKDIKDPGAERADDQYTHVAAGTGILPYEHYLKVLARAYAAGSDRKLPLILHGLEEAQVPASVAFVRNSINTLSRHAVLSEL